MSDETTAPVEPTDRSSTADSSQQQAGQSPAGNTDWKARFDGQVRKIEELTLRARSLEGQLDTKTSEIEQLRAQLSIKDTERTTAVSERDKTIQEMTQSRASIEGELKRLRGLEMKVKVAREMGRPDLMRVLETIPNVTDETALKTVMETFSDYADNAVREREKQLLSGLTPPINGAGTKGTNAPSSEAAWQEHINGLPLGSPERAKAHDDYWNWLVTKHQNL
jgi:chromosome segregation ATPase